MNTRNSIIVLIVVVLVIAFGIYWVEKQGPATAVQTGTPVASVDYSCDAGKTIHADYYQGTDTPGQNGGPPTPGGSAQIKLSDGRNLTLAQTISADGTRYSDGDPNTQGSETFVFWSKGNGALVLENNEAQTYTGCVKLAPATQDLTGAYASGADGFSIRYPQGYTVDESYKYQALGPGKDISGTKFTIAASLATGTNLSTDSYVSVEQLPQTAQCSADLFVDTANGAHATTLTDGDTTYSFASTTDAAAGNRYEEMVYALPGTNPCMTVRYFIHYGVFENYPAGTVQEFNQAALLAQFDEIRRSLIVNQ